VKLGGWGSKGKKLYDDTTYITSGVQGGKVRKINPKNKTQLNEDLRKKHRENPGHLGQPLRS